MKLEGSLDIIKDLTVDTNTLVTDSVNNRVGIGTATPSSKLNIKDSAPVFTLESSATEASLPAQIMLFSTSSGTRGGVGWNASSDNFIIQNASGGVIHFASLGVMGGFDNGHFFVDTNTLYVDSTLNKVGIGKTPSVLTKTLDVNGDVNIDGDLSTTTLELVGSGATAAQVNFQTNVNPTAPNNGDLWWNGTNLYFNDGATDVDLLAGGGADTNFALDSLTFDADQTHTLASFDLTLSTTGDASAFKIDGGLGYVGIGIVPTEKFEVLGDSKFVGEIKHSGFYTYLDTEGTNPPLQLHQEVISDIGRLTFEGTTGGLLTIIDDKDNELWTASDVSGNPIGYIDADWLVQFGNPFARPFKIVYNSGDGSSEIFLDLPTVAGTTGSLYVDGSGFVKVAP